MAKILLIEDDFYIRSLYKTVLGEGGHGVSEASDGEEALSKLSSEAPPDVILLDIMLPKISGVEVLKKIRSHPALRKIPVIVLTNVDSDAIMKDVMEVGAEKYLVKSSIPVNKLGEEIEGVLKK